MTTMPHLLEVCVADVESLDAAIAGGADRIELCASLEVGGLTPAPGLMARAARAPVPVYAMIRPRSGDFIFTAGELAVMLEDIAKVRQTGLAGVVLGASNADGTLDVTMLEQLTAASAGLGTTLHRAFDLVPDIDAAVAAAVSLGFERILTSGRQPRAIDGLADITHAFNSADGRIGIMPGAGITSENVDHILDQVPVAEIHASCSAPRPQSKRLAAVGITPTETRPTSTALVQALKHKLSG